MSCSNKEERLTETTEAPEEIKDVVDIVVEEDTYSIWADLVLIVIGTLRRFK